MINDHVLPMHWQAEMARLGLHDLMPCEDMDSGTMVDPLEDPETLKAIRSFLPKLFKARQSDMCARCGTLLVEYASLNGKWYCHHDSEVGRPTCYEYAKRQEQSDE